MFYCELYTIFMKNPLFLPLIETAAPKNLSYLKLSEREKEKDKTKTLIYAVNPV